MPYKVQIRLSLSVPYGGFALHVSSGTSWSNLVKNSFLPDVRPTGARRGRCLTEMIIYICIVQLIWISGALLYRLPKFEFTLNFSSASLVKGPFTNNLTFSVQIQSKRSKNNKRTYLKFENHFTNCAVLFLLNLMSGKYILRTAELGYRTQKNINFAFLRCIGVRVDECSEVKETSG